MADEKWQKVREIFDSALRRKPEERQNYIVEVCGEDKTLLLEVESLLSSLENIDSFMESPAVAKVADAIEGETKKLETGRCFGHYEIIAPIGAGGMGEVYLAKDKKLDRKVAVKILNEKFSRDESNLKRFIREAKAASALDHPNILVIHEIGEVEDAHFIVSEFIKGKTLREILKQSILNLPEILDISIQIAAALAAAHEAGLVHRDIKPENIMVRTDDYVKVLDFGLAKLVQQKNKSILGLDGESTLDQNDTAQGVILGTVNYMSPEQAKGERVDARTDIFSFGVVIYEMIAGKTPFASDSGAETLAYLITAEPLPLASFAGAVPDKLQKIVAKTLRKNRDKRYQTINDLLADLKDLRENLKAEEKLERFTSAVAPQFLTDSDYFKQNEVEKDSNQTLISEPVNAFQGYELWRFHYQQIAPADLVKARAFLEEAVRLDPDYALAHAALAVQAVQEAVVGLNAPAESFPQAKAAIQRASELDSSSAEFYAAAGFIDMVCDWNFTEAERKVRKALELNPYHAFANNYLGQVFMFRCQPDEAEPYLRRACEIEPMGLHNNIVLIMSYFLARNYQKVIEECEKSLALYPRYFIAAQVRCWALEQTGRASEAVHEYEKILGEPHGEIARRWMGYAYAITGKREKALETAVRLDAESREHYLSPTHQAQIYAGLGETDRAVTYLKDAFEKRDPWMLWIAADPRYDNLRGDSRFCELVERVLSNPLAEDSDAHYQIMKIPTLDEKSEKPYSHGNTAAILSATTGDVNENTVETQSGFSRSIKNRKSVFAFTTFFILLAGAIAFYWNFDQSPSVQDLYLQGRFYAVRENRADNDKAIQLLEQAVKLDPNHALAYTELARAYGTRFFQLEPQQKQWQEKAYVALDKAFTINPDLAEAHEIRGFLLWMPANRFPHEQAIAAYHRAAELNPNLDEPHQQLGKIYLHIGLLDEALTELRKALELNPGNTMARYRIGIVLIHQGKYEEAQRNLKTTPPEINPAIVGRDTVWLLISLGQREAAAALLDELVKKYPVDEGGQFASFKALLSAMAGNAAQAELEIRDALEKGRGFGHFHHTAYIIACAYAALNKPEEAVRFLQTAADEGYPCYPLVEQDAKLDAIRQNPKFQFFLSELKREWEYYKSLPHN